MTRLSESFFIPERPETVGASAESVRELVELGEECILLQATHTEKVLGQIAVRGEYATYMDMVQALEHRYIMEEHSNRALTPNWVDMQSMRQWKRYIEALRPDLHGLIEEFNIDTKLPDPLSPKHHTIPAKWLSRSLAYRTIISRKGLERLAQSDEHHKKTWQTNPRHA